MTKLSQRARNKQDKENRILKAALKVFSETGFSGASMDVIAVQADLSKPTLYQYFASKEALFEAVLLAPRIAMLDVFKHDSQTDMVPQLHRFAWRYSDTVMRPDLLSLARLIIGEAHRFPHIGRDYQHSGPDKVLSALVAFMDAQRVQNRLRFEDPELAAEDFWGLILSAPRNRALHIPDADISRTTLSRYINNGLSVFLKAYSIDPQRDLAKLSEIIKQDEAAPL